MSSRGAVGETLSADEALALLPHVLKAMTTAEWWRRSEDELAEAVVAFHRAESQCAAAGVAVVAEAVSRGVPVSCGQKDGARWCARWSRSSPRSRRRARHWPMPSGRRRSR